MPISIRLGEELERRLDQLARLTGRSKAWYIRQALAEKLEDLEDLYIAENRLEKAEPRIDLAALEQELGVED